MESGASRRSRRDWTGFSGEQGNSPSPEPRHQLKKIEWEMWEDGRWEMEMGDGGWEMDGALIRRRGRGVS